MKSLIISTVSLIFLCCTTQACRPILRLIESQCCGDDYIEIAREWIGVNNEPNITAKGIKNSYLSTCPEGVWMGYEYENYTGSTYLMSGRNDGLNNCRYENTGRKVRSAKIVGSPADFSSRAVVTYTARWEEGVDNTFFNDTTYLDLTFDSVIIMGQEEVEFFTGSYFNGLSVCVYPNNGHINSWKDFQERNPLQNGTDLFTVLGELKNTLGTNEFHSFQFGCRENTNTLLEHLIAQS